MYYIESHDNTNKKNRIFQGVLVGFQLFITVMQFIFILLESQHYMIHHDFVIIVFQYLLQKFLYLCIIIENLFDNIVLGSLRVSIKRRAYLTYIIIASTTCFLFFEAIGLLILSVILRKDIAHVEDNFEEVFKDIDDPREPTKLRNKLTAVHDSLFEFASSLHLMPDDQVTDLLWSGLGIDVFCLGIWMILCSKTFFRYRRWENEKSELEKMLGEVVNTGSKNLQ